MPKDEIEHESPITTIPCSPSADSISLFRPHNTRLLASPSGRAFVLRTEPRCVSAFGFNP